MRLRLACLSSLLFVAACTSTPADDCTTTGTCPATDDMSMAAAVPDLTVFTCNPACTGGTPFCNSAHNCVPCLVDDNCPTGQVCKTLGAGSACVPGCADDARCNKGAGNMVCCNQQCVDPGSDTANCGGCGMACAPTNAIGQCAGGKCTVTGCKAGFGDCDNNPATGCEAPTRVDPANCGGCGKKCSFKNGIAGCADTCYLKSCQFGWDDCNNDPMDGCEKSVLTDPANCGACGTSCAVAPHAHGQCITAACVLTCDLGWSDCDGNAQNGCELPTDADTNNCGACKKVCPQGLVCLASSCTCPNCQLPNAKTMCVNNACLIDVCLPGWGNCDGNTQNGCETNVNTDANNCTNCGNVCPMNTPYCVNGQCSISTHNILSLAYDFTSSPACGDSSSFYTQSFGMQTFDACEVLANKYGAIYIGSPNLSGYNAPYANSVRWVGEKDAGNGYVSTGGWNQVTPVSKNTPQLCVLGYGNGKSAGNMVLGQSMVSQFNQKTYMVMDFGVTAENTCYTNARNYGARTLNPMAFGINQTSHMVENHSCHGSIEYQGNSYGADGNTNHNYHCFIGYNP